MAKKTKVPFGMMPASWGLKGKTRAIAEAEYYYEGNELEEILATLNADTDIDKEVAKLDVQFKNGQHLPTTKIACDWLCCTRQGGKPAHSVDAAAHAELSASP